MGHEPVDHLRRGGGGFDEFKVFLWGWCDHCGGAFVVCPFCGNNTCNGSFGNSDGSVGGGSPDFACLFCNLAYQFMQVCYKFGGYPRSRDEVGFFNELVRREHGGCDVGGCEGVCF